MVKSNLQVPSDARARQAMLADMLSRSDRAGGAAAGDESPAPPADRMPESTAGDAR